jgi:hypothetical protein
MTRGFAHDQKPLKAVNENQLTKWRTNGAGIDGTPFHTGLWGTVVMALIFDSHGRLLMCQANPLHINHLGYHKRSIFTLR